MMNIAIIGFGEVGGIFAEDLAARGAVIRAWDVDPAARRRAGALAAPSLVAALEGAAVAILCVTAGSVLEAAGALAESVERSSFVLDVNSISPATKQAAARLVEGAGGRYVEAAVMASVPPKRLATPMLLGGPHAGAFVAAMAPFAMRLTAFSDEIGRASSVKMCRSVMIKGIEALTTECMLAARHYGVEAEVLATLGDTLPHPDWHGLARYVISRALIHGKRRAEEMREVARTVADAGVEPLLSEAIALRQDWAFQRGREIGEDRHLPTLEPLLDSMLATVKRAAE